MFLFVLMLYISVNSYDHVETVCSPNHTISWASLTKQLTRSLGVTVKTTILVSFEGGE